MISGNSAMATVEDDHLVLNPRLRGKRHDLRERDAVVSSPAVTSAKIATGCFQMSMTCEIEKRDLIVS